MSHFKNVNVVHFYVTDWEQAKKFYGEVLEWPVAWASDEAGWVEYGRENETHIAINRWEGPEPVPSKNSSTTVVLTVGDAHEVTRAPRSRGVRCDDVVTIPGMVTYGAFYDPEGNRAQFASSQMPEG